MQRTYLEMSSDVVTAMISKGQLVIKREKDEDWKIYNKKAIRTVGWAILEMYREIGSVPKKAIQTDGQDHKKSKIITSAR